MVQALLAGFIHRRQRRGELLQVGVSPRAVTPDEVERLVLPTDHEALPTDELTRIGAAKASMWEAFAACERAMGRAFAWPDLARCLGLSDDELELLLVTWCCAISPHLSRVQRFAWNDFGRRHPTAIFLWELCRPERPDLGRSRLMDIVSDSPLVRWRLLELVPSGPSPLFAEVRLHTHLFDLLRGDEQPRLGAVEVVSFGDPVSTGARRHQRQPRLAIGPPGSGRTTASIQRATGRGARLCRAQVPAALAEEPVAAVETWAVECVRDAVLKQAELHLDGLERLSGKPAAEEAFLAVFAAAPIAVTVATSAPAPSGLPILARYELLRTGAPDRNARQRWLLENVGDLLRAPEREDIAARYSLTTGQLTEVIRRARFRAAQPSALGRPKSLSDLVHDEARRELHTAVNTLATPVITRLTWDDLIIDDTTRDALLSIVRFVRHRKTVYETWDFGSKFDYGAAVTALFEGPPGTGKTMAAGLIARELGLEIYRVSLSQLVSKWVGETEKNLERVFQFAEQKGVALLFDEADSLFGKRTTLSSASDRYANLETNYLLQRLEHFEGIALLTTNFGGELDDAFERRIRFRVTFEQPTPALRERLWRSMIPPEAPLAPGQNLGRLARAFEMSGGHIKEAVVSAAFEAAEGEVPIAFEHFWRAGEQQYKKMGRVFVAARAAST